MICEFDNVYKFRFCILPFPPLISCDGRNVAAGVWIKVLLKELTLAGHHERNDLAEAVVVDAEESGKTFLIRTCNCFRSYSSTNEVDVAASGIIVNSS